MTLTKCWLAGVLAAALPSLLAAQRVLGPGDDAWPLPAGVMRVGLATRFVVGDEWFDARGQRDPLGAWLTRSAITATTFPGLVAAERSIRDVTGDPAFSLSLGGVSADVRRQVQVVPLELALGITSRLTLRVMAPLVGVEHQTNWRSSATGATVGANPALSGTGTLAQHTSLVSGLQSSATAIDALADGCAADATSDARCGLVLSEITQVRSLASATRTFGDAIGRTYGGAAGITPGAFVPLATTDAHAQVGTAITALRDAYARYGETGIDPTLGVVGAATPLTVADLHALLEDADGAYALGPWGRRYQQGWGDIDVGLWYRLFDGAGDRPWSRLGTSAGRRWRQSVGATMRLGTGSPVDPDDPLMLATGDGQHDVEVTSATDLLWGAHAWGSLLVRYTKQLGDERVARLPDAALAPYLPLTRRVLAERTPGDRIQIELAPRWVFNDYLAVGTRYRFMHEAATVWREISPASGAVALQAEGAAITAHEASFGVTWSSIAAWQRGRSKRPIEISWERGYVFAGEGEILAARSDRLGVLVYAKLWGK
jgi:hypothetical protein